MEIEDLYIKLLIIFVVFMVLAILAFICDIDSKISNTQNNCIIVNNENYCKAVDDK